MRRRVGDAARAMEGEVISGDPETMFEGAALDTRKLQGGELFFALPGEHSDGHCFVAEALRRGAAAAVIHRPVPASSEATLVEVEDTLRALHALTRSVRRQVPRKLVGITGSLGKTTTKELLAAMMATRFRVGRSPGNLNNLYGFPLALLSIADDCEWMVAEMGMSTPGELAGVSRLGRPDVAVFTNVQPAHLEVFGSLRAIAEAKAELLAGLAADGLVVANADDAEVTRIVRRHSGPIVWYGIQIAAEVQATDIGPRGAGQVGSRFLLRVGQEVQEVELPLHGQYNVGNCLAAAACAQALGVPLSEIARSVAAIQPAPGRGVVHRLSGPLTVVDDSYNSNPHALAEALASAARLPAERRWAVLGDMLELGPQASALHREAGVEAAHLGFSPVVGVGDLARQIVLGAESAGARGCWFSGAAEAAEWSAGEARAGDLVLIKGSRGVGLEVVVERLLEREGAS